MGTNCNGARYLNNCHETTICCKKGNDKEVKKRKMYQEYIDASTNNDATSFKSSKKKNKLSFPENGNYSDAGSNFNHLVGSNYYESNDEVFCIDTNDVRNIKTQANDRQNVNKRVENMKKIDDIKSYYKISFDGHDLLGNGAFAMVRLASKVFDQSSVLNYNDS